jgi:hypothetical protein
MIEHYTEYLINPYISGQSRKQKGFAKPIGRRY